MLPRYQDAPSGPQPAYVPLAAALVWIMYRCEGWLSQALTAPDPYEFLLEADRLASDIGAFEDPLRITQTSSEAAANLEIASMQASLQLYAPRGSDSCVELSYNDLVLDNEILDAHQNRTADLKGRRRRANLSVSLAQLKEAFKPRDHYAEEAFRSTVWTVPMTAHWVATGAWKSFFDLYVISQHDKAIYTLIDDAIRRGVLHAVDNGRRVDPLSWYAQTISDAYKIRFERSNVLDAFPTEHCFPARQEIDTFLATLPPHTSRNVAVSDALRRFPDRKKIVEELVASYLRFKPIPRGRPAGSKNRKGLSDKV